MCVVCVSAVTVASLIAPSPTPVAQNNVTEYKITQSPCPKSKLNKIENNRICLKNGTVYRWAVKKTVTAPTPKPTITPSPTPSPAPSEQPKPTTSTVPLEPTKPTPSPVATIETYSPPSVSADNIELCKLKEASQRRGYTWAGFPGLTPLTQKTGTVKWALIPIDFNNLKGEQDFRSRVDNDMKLLSEWFETVSEGRLKIEWVVADRWTTIPGVSSDYPLTKTTGVNNTPGGIKLFKAAMAAADPHFDFTNVQTVNFILPLNQNIANEGENGFPWDQHIKDTVTNEGRISSFSIAGHYQTKDKKTLWNYWAHEFGHGIGLPHIGGNSGYSSFHNWDVLGNQDGVSRELSGWVRFLAGWMSDDQVFCKEAKSLNKVEINLIPISNKESGIKMGIFPLSPTKALIVESRRVTKFSCTTPTERNGVLVYSLDLTLGNGQDFLSALLPVGRNSQEVATCNGVTSGIHFNELLKQGDSIMFEGIKVEVIKQGKFDKVVITK